MYYMKIFVTVIHIIGAIVLFTNIKSRSWWLKNRRLISAVVFLTAAINVMTLL